MIENRLCGSCYLPLIIAFTLFNQLLVGQETRYREGLQESPPNCYALSGATVHVSPGMTIENAVVVIRGSKLVEVSVDAALPSDAKVIDMTGRHIYSGFIDAYLPTEFELPQEGTSYWNEQVRTQLTAANYLDLSNLKTDSFRKAGFAAGLVVPAQGILKGRSSVVHFSDGEEEDAILKQQVFQHARLTVRRGFGSGYPNSPMGAVALARQAMYDAQWYQRAHRAARNNDSLPRPETNSSLESLQDVINGEEAVVFETSNELFVMRAQRFANEFDLQYIIKGSGNEYRRLDSIVALNRPIILPLDFPEAPDVSDPTAAMDITLETLMHWDHAPENPGRLANAGVKLAFTSDGLDDAEEMLEHVRLSIKRGLKPEDALSALTTNAAELFGVSNQLGTVEKGKLASIVVMDKPFTDDKSKVMETWVAGQRFEFESSRLRKPEGVWELASELDFLNGKSISITKKRAEFVAPEEGEDEEAIKIESYSQSGARISGLFDGTKLGQPGMHRFSLLLMDDQSARGQFVASSGAVTRLSAIRTGEAKADDKGGEKKPRNGHGHSTANASYPVNYPLGMYGRTKHPPSETILNTHATIWTNAEPAIIENGAVLISDGLIQGVYTAEDDLPQVDKVIDVSGMHLTAGIIDCHSHMATDSGVNESGQTVTAEVRIGDMVDCDDINIFRQLAGGVTAVSILHGSANPIGGQNQVIKLRWGAEEEEMKFKAAPAGIKFALGENVKRSRSRDSTRYPRTRMGVEQIMHDRFRAAIEYSERWARYERNKQGIPPRVDLELKALAEIVAGERWIHCHSYRQDEILALIRVLDEYDITIGTFQHILEGYKVADAMAEHGAMASAFADWWAYKFEVYDAIPYAGALMHNAGVVVSFNSDDRELARHLNHEAAKAVKYGNVPETEALKFVTLNPAKQLRIDHLVGSIEVGKQADLALWSGHPLSPMTRCEKTWVDGRRYFDYEKSIFDAEAFASMRNELVQKVLGSGQEMKVMNIEDWDPATLWPRFDEFCHDHDHHDDE